MTLYRKRPIAVEARRLTWEHMPEVVEWCGGVMLYDPSGKANGCRIDTNEGPMTAFLGDWVIKEPFPTDDRLFYPCKPDIFEATYELAIAPDGIPVAPITMTGAGGVPIPLPPSERRVQDATGTDAQVEAGWRERALAAEEAVSVIMSGNVTIEPPGIGTDYGWIRTTPEVLATVERLAVRDPDGGG